MRTPTVVLVLGIGMFSFGKNKTEARINRRILHKCNSRHGGCERISFGHNLGRSTAGWSGRQDRGVQRLLQLRSSVRPYEAFRIEYWQLEEAKIRRQPPEKELSRQICLIVGGG